MGLHHSVLQLSFADAGGSRMAGTSTGTLSLQGLLHHASAVS